jgi:hypothetical protein
MANVRPTYDAVKHSGVSSQEQPRQDQASYNEARFSGIAVLDQPDSPDMPTTDLPTVEPYSQLKN